MRSETQSRRALDLDLALDVIQGAVGVSASDGGLHRIAADDDALSHPGHEPLDGEAGSLLALATRLLPDLASAGDFGICLPRREPPSRRMSTPLPEKRNNKAQNNNLYVEARTWIRTISPKYTLMLSVTTSPS